MDFFSFSLCSTLVVGRARPEILHIILYASPLFTHCDYKVEQESERIGKDAVECQVIADDAQADLAVAMPALEKAMAEVDKLDKTSITEVRHPDFRVQAGDFVFHRQAC